jgi:hypothetical protein
MHAYTVVYLVHSLLCNVQFLPIFTSSERVNGDDRSKGEYLLSRSAHTMKTQINNVNVSIAIWQPYCTSRAAF